MSSMRWASVKEHRSKALFFSFLIALALELSVFFILGLNSLHSPFKNSSPYSHTDQPYLEAEIVQLPEQAHLIEDKPIKKSSPSHEVVLSKTPGKGVEASPDSALLEEENQTESGTPLSEDHGPIAIIAPRPIIPNYLQGDDLKTYVIIDFYVNTEGLPNPRLVASSENQELDAIALETAQKWRFRPAEKDKKPIAARVRLRIVFAVE